MELPVEDMIRNIAKQLVDRPEKVQVNVVEGNQTTVVELRGYCHPRDNGVHDSGVGLLLWHCRPFCFTLQSLGPASKATSTQRTHGSKRYNDGAQIVQRGKEDGGNCAGDGQKNGDGVDCKIRAVILSDESQGFRRNPARHKDVSQTAF
jgi:hypothetical protein